MLGERFAYDPYFAGSAIAQVLNGIHIFFDKHETRFFLPGILARLILLGNGHGKARHIIRAEGHQHVTIDLCRIHILDIIHSTPSKAHLHFTEYIPDGSSVTEVKIVLFEDVQVILCFLQDCFREGKAFTGCHLLKDLT